MSPHFLSRRSVVAAMGASTLALPGLASAASGAAAPEFTGIEGWLNSGPLTMHGLRGRVVLVNFFARSCINCIHAMPAIKSWYAKYRSQGFVVVGVHTPEFDVEKSRPALEAALARYGLTYPVEYHRTIHPQHGMPTAINTGLPNISSISPAGLSTNILERADMPKQSA